MFAAIQSYPESMSSLTKRIISTILLCVVLTALLFLAFQSASDSYKLSDQIMNWTGIRDMSRSDFRIYAHIPGYLIIGLVLLFFGKTHQIKPWLMIIAGLFLGLGEEVLKQFVPTRDFDWLDIGMDAIGISTATLIFLIIVLIRKGWR